MSPHNQSNFHLSMRTDECLSSRKGAACARGVPERHSLQCTVARMICLDKDRHTLFVQTIYVLNPFSDMEISSS